jgi:hypothetical protein
MGRNRGTVLISFTRQYEAFGEGSTATSQRTTATKRPPLTTYQRPEVDETECDRPRIPLGYYLCQKPPESIVVTRPGTVGTHPETAPDHADDVRIEQWCTLAEGNDRDRIRDVAADPRQRHQLFDARGHPTVEARLDLACQQRQSGAPMREPERAKKRNDLLLIGGGECINGRVAVDQSRERCWHEIGARPLQEQFRDQDLVWVTAASPWKVATMPHEPSAHLSTQPGSFVRFQRWNGGARHDCRVFVAARPEACTYIAPWHAVRAA